MIVTQVRIGPRDRGRRMSLEEFASAQGAEGYRYELAQGEVVVVEIPGLPHGLIVQALHLHLRTYQQAHADRVCYVAAGSDCALRLPGMKCERHPDLSVYLTAAPEVDDPWDLWVPDLVAEVVSPGKDSHDRDYVEKREEYLAAGVREYWIVNPGCKRLTVLQRRGDRWQECVPVLRHRTRLLPDFRLDLAALLRVVSKRRGS